MANIVSWLPLCVFFYAARQQKENKNMCEIQAEQMGKTQQAVDEL